MKRGLTLIELLVVIGIIIVLSGITWFVFASVKEKARQVECKNNLRQIWVALEQYRHDYDGLEIDETPREYWELGLPERISILAIAGYLEKPLRCPNDLTPFYSKISRWYTSYSRGWWGKESLWYRWGHAKFPEWIAAFGYDLPMVLDLHHDPYYDLSFYVEGIRDPDISRNWTIWITFGGAVKTGWFTPPTGSPKKSWQ